MDDEEFGCLTVFFFIVLFMGVILVLSRCSMDETPVSKQEEIVAQINADEAQRREYQRYFQAAPIVCRDGVQYIWLYNSHGSSATMRVHLDGTGYPCIVKKNTPTVKPTASPTAKPTMKPSPKPSENPDDGLERTL